ncbi:glycosyltransferase [Lacisediminimonas sp.]|uniref:glycosyltransferase n=1 Tax=Lacisediminimonas sp. TaxID=3060582 RepID=UPI0027164B65|nr:glycosyltransferase [Lacisediminimonas sp.]MDO8300774.1 glycosyltransferase [Lacisediminimonas sp.]
MYTRRILVIHNRYRHRGGEDVVVDDEVQMLREHGQIVQVYGRDNASIGQMARTTLARETMWSSRTMTELGQHIDSFAPDVIHVHNSFPLVSPSLYWAAARRSCPVVQTLHNFRLMCLQAMFLRNNRICEDCKGAVPWRGVMRGCYHDSAAQSAVLAGMLVLHRGLGTYQRKVTRYIALNEFSRDKFIEGGLPAERIVVKPNFVQPQPQPAQGTFRSGALFVGRLSLEKGLSLMAEALALLPSMTVGVIGDGPEMPLVRAHAQLHAMGQLNRAEVMRHMQGAAYLPLGCGPGWR